MDIDYKVVKQVGVVSTSSNGWTTEVNLISWNGREAKYDIRSWSPDHGKMSKGVTLTKDEVEKFYELIGKEIGK